MYYKDQYGNVVEYSSESVGGHSGNGIHPGGVGYHPLSRENFDMASVKTWFEKYKMWILYAIILVIILIMVMWYMKMRKHKRRSSSSSPPSRFY